MKKSFYFFFIFIPAVILAGCSSGNSDSSFTLEKGDYKFIMTDSLKSKLAEGILTVKTISKDKFSGTYKFTKKHKDFSGLEVMNGEFSGEINKAENKVFINTNPRIADSNVFWNLKFTKSSLSGSWVHSVFRGTSSGGYVKITSE
ncbi:MAG: hypothetical protein HGGPFJEG_00641 [Ignavibacteria bacterium]|nr:hypothetical protein [Ignavibacteria bacterium]